MQNSERENFVDREKFIQFVNWKKSFSGMENLFRELWIGTFSAFSLAWLRRRSNSSTLRESRNIIVEIKAFFSFDSTLTRSRKKARRERFKKSTQSYVCQVREPEEFSSIDLDYAWNSRDYGECYVYSRPIQFALFTLAALFAPLRWFIAQWKSESAWKFK